MKATVKNIPAKRQSNGRSSTVLPAGTPAPEFSLLSTPAAHKVPLVWSDCFWTAEISKTTQLSEMIEIIHHRKALHHPGVAVASKEDRE